MNLYLIQWSHHHALSKETEIKSGGLQTFSQWYFHNCCRAHHRVIPLLGLQLISYVPTIGEIF